MTDISLQIEPDLALRTAGPTHSTAFLALVERNRQHFGRYLPKVTEIDSIEKANLHMAHCLERLAARELFEFHVFRNAVLCGAVRLNNFEWENKKASIAYLLDSAHEGRGIVTRASRAVLAFAFEELGLNRVELRCVTINSRSICVVERLGFVREGELREVEWLDGRAEDHYVYALLRGGR